MACLQAFGGTPVRGRADAAALHRFEPGGGKWANLFGVPLDLNSEKCTRQLSRESTLPMDAAQPPSAMTVCALPKRDLQISPVLRPWAEHSMEARKPAPPAPITITSAGEWGLDTVLPLSGIVWIKMMSAEKR